MGKGYRFVRNAAKKQADLYIYEDVGEGFWGGFSANQFKDDLKGLGEIDQINLHINSFGGDVFDGLAIYRLLVDHPAKVVTHVDGFAASIASVIAMAGDTIMMSESGMIMIHNASGIVMGEAADMEKMAGALRTITGALADVYIARTGNTAAQIKEWMDAETWFNSADAIANNFADEIIPNLEMAAHATAYDPTRYRFKKTPATVTARATSTPRPRADHWRQQIEMRRAGLTYQRLRR